MQVKNGYVLIEPIKEGLIAVEGNEYKVIDSPIQIKSVLEEGGAFTFKNFEPGDIIVVEDQLVIRLTVAGKECCFVKEENILAKVNDCTPNCDCRAQV